MTFYGSSFIADQRARWSPRPPRTGEAVLTATFDLERIRAYRTAWGVFRDRRPDMYGPLLTLDGKTP